MLKRLGSEVLPYLVVIERGAWVRKPNPLYREVENRAKMVSWRNQSPMTPTIPIQNKLVDLEHDINAYRCETNVPTGRWIVEGGCCEKK